MPNRRWSQPHGNINQEIKTVALGIVIICIIVYLLFPNFIRSIFFSINQTETSLNNVAVPSTYDPNAASLSGYPIQNSPTNSEALTAGYWILFVSNETFQQLPVTSGDYVFVQGLIQRDKGSRTISVFLIDNGQIHQYVVSNETYSVISNIATINTRGSNSSTYFTPPDTTLPSTAINVILTVSYPSTSGFTVYLSPALNGLTINNFTLVDSSGNPVALTGATTSVGGATYAITATLNAGQTYSLTTSAVGYTFGTAQSVVVPY